MVVKSVSKTTVFGRIMFVLLVFAVAIGGVCFYQYYQDHKDIKDKPSVSLTSSSDSFDILSRKDDMISIHAVTDDFNGIVTWDVQERKFFHIRGDDTNELGLTLIDDYTEPAPKTVYVTATIPNATGPNTYAKYPIHLQKSASEIGRIKYTTTGRLQVAKSDTYTIGVTAVGSADLTYLQFNDIPGLSITANKYKTSANITISLAGENPAGPGTKQLTLSSSIIGNFDQITLDIPVFAQESQPSISYVSHTPVLAGTVSTGEIRIKLHDIPTTATYTWNTPVTGLGFDTNYTVSPTDSTIIIFTYNSTIAAVAGPHTTGLSTRINNVGVFDTEVTIVVEQMPTIKAVVTTTTDTTPGKIQVKNDAKKAKIVVSSLYTNSAGYPLLTSAGDINLAELPASLAGTWTQNGTGANTTISAEINWVDAGSLSLAAGTQTILLKPLSTTNELFPNYELQIEVAAPKAIVPTVTGFLTLGVSSSDVTINTVLKNGVSSTDLAVPAVVGFEFDSAWTAVGTDQASITVAISSTETPALGETKFSIEPNTLHQDEFAAVEVGVTVVDIPSNPIPTMSAVTDGKSLQIDSSTGKITTNFTFTNTYDDLSSTSVLFGDATAASSSSILDYVNVSVPTWNGLTHKWTSVVTLKTTPVSDIVPGTYQVIYPATVKNLANADTSLSATIDILIADVPVVKSFTLAQTGTITMGEDPLLTTNQIIVTVSPLNGADLSTVQIDPSSEAANTNIGHILFNFSSLTTQIDGSKVVTISLGNNAAPGSYELIVKDNATVGKMSPVSITLEILPAKTFTLSVSGPLTFGDDTTGVTVTATSPNGLDLSAIVTGVPAGTSFVSSGGTCGTWDVSTSTAPVITLTSGNLVSTGVYPFQAIVGTKIMLIDINVVPPAQIALEQTGILQIGATASKITIDATAMYGAEFVEGLGFGGTLISDNSLIVAPTFVQSDVNPDKGTISLAIGTNPKVGTYTFYLTDGDATTPVAISKEISVTILPKKALKAVVSNKLQLGSSGTTATITVTALNSADLATVNNLPLIDTQINATPFVNGVSTISLGNAPTVGEHSVLINSSSTDTSSVTVIVEIVNEAKLRVAVVGSLQIGKDDSVTATVSALDWVNAPIWTAVTISGAGINDSRLAITSLVVDAANPNVATFEISLGGAPLTGTYNLSAAAAYVGLSTTFSVFVQAAKYIEAVGTSGKLQCGESSTITTKFYGHEGAALTSLAATDIPLYNSTAIFVCTIADADTDGSRTVTISLQVDNDAVVGNHDIVFGAGTGIAPLTLTVNVLPHKNFDALLAGQLHAFTDDVLTLHLSNPANGLVFDNASITAATVGIYKGADTTTNLVTSGKFSVIKPTLTGAVTSVNLQIKQSAADATAPLPGDDYYVTVDFGNNITRSVPFTIATSSVYLTTDTAIMQYGVTTDQITITAHGSYLSLAALDNGVWGGTYQGFGAYTWNSISAGATTRTGIIKVNSASDFPMVGNYSIAFNPLSTSNVTFPEIALNFVVIHNESLGRWFTPDSPSYTFNSGSTGNIIHLTANTANGFADLKHFLIGTVAPTPVDLTEGPYLEYTGFGISQVTAWTPEVGHDSLSGSLLDPASRDLYVDVGGFADTGTYYLKITAVSSTDAQDYMEFYYITITIA